MPAIQGPKHRIMFSANIVRKVVKRGYGVGRKVKSTAASVISKSSEGISKVTKSVVRRDASARYDDLLKLKQLLDADAVTLDEFEAEKRKILDP